MSSCRHKKKSRAKQSKNMQLEPGYTPMTCEKFTQARKKGSPRDVSSKKPRCSQFRAFREEEMRFTSAPRSSQEPAHIAAIPA
jgi:hypothetical protein